jgi:hypothetical protein
MQGKGAPMTRHGDQPPHCGTALSQRPLQATRPLHRTTPQHDGIGLVRKRGGVGADTTVSPAAQPEAENC